MTGKNWHNWPDFSVKKVFSGLGQGLSDPIAS